MKRLVFALALVVAILFVSAAAVWAFELLSPPIDVVADTRLICAIFNFAADTGDMEVEIQVLSQQDGSNVFEGPLRCTNSLAGNRAFCTSGVQEFPAAVCRFKVTGVSAKSVRASAQLIRISTGDTLVALEAR